MKIKQYTKLGAAILCALLLLAGCTPPVSQSGASGISAGGSSAASQSITPQPLAPGAITAQNYPIVDGSTATLPLMAEVYSRVCGVPRVQAEQLVSASKTSDAWMAIANGSADLLLVYEAPEETLAWLEEQETELEIAAIGLDALVFITNEQNPVESLTQQQLQDIYTGKITNWSDVGGNDSPIAAYQRNPDSGSQALFIKLLMQGEEPMQAPTEYVVGGMGGLIDALAAFDGEESAIGYSVYYYASEMYAQPGLRFMAVDDIMPSHETIAAQSYPFTNSFYVVIRADEPQNSPARMLRNWLFTEEGIAALTDAGYVSAL